ncbi:hypothetical protein JIN77_02595 [Verrucomicrobiaceae bacterium R5-34]|nr:hypothetical protein [Verrucomicrobiaceae bacterium R5-34]
MQMNSSKQMIKEFAIAPETFSNYADIRFLLKEFSLSKGRVIGRYPNKWPKKVTDVVKNYDDDIQISRVIEWLSMIKGFLLTERKEPYDGTEMTWLENAKIANDANPFHAVISPHASEEPNLINLGDIENAHPLWEMKATEPVECTLEGLCDPVDSVLGKASEVCIIDPYYTCEPKCYKPLKRLLSAAVRGTPLEQFIYHTGIKAGGTSDFFLDHLDEHIKIDRDGEKCQVLFLRWDISEDTGAKLHDRFLLTNHCGFMYGRGFSIEPNQRSSIVRIGADMDDILSEFDLEEPKYTLHDAFLVTPEGSRKLSLEQLKSAIGSVTHVNQ